MNPARLQSMERNLTGIARKVLESTPVAESWTVQRIYAELRRLGHSTEFRTVSGCLASLREQGLVTELRGCGYQRMTPRPQLVTPPAPAPETEPQQEAATPPATTTAAAKPAAKPATKPELHPLKQVEALAAEARAIAQRAGELAARIEDLALDFEQRMEVVASETKKLRQLQELLRSIA